MSVKGPKQRTYWLADEISAALHARAALLAQKGYDVHFFTSIEGMVQELHKTRAGVIIVSDDFDDRIIERILLTLMNLPVIQGARMVMVRSKATEAVSSLAACANFRDILPADLEPRQWLTRFIYATAGQALHFVQPSGQVTLNNISALALPARVTWISSKRLRLECRVRPPIGASLNLRGPLAEAAGVSSIGLTVVEAQRSHLLYRFSDAIVAEWRVPAAARPQLDTALRDIKGQDPGPRCRVFIAITAPLLRTETLALFADPRFEVSTALRKQSIVEAPRFFTPDVVIIEAALVSGESAERFAQMMANLSQDATVIIAGRSPDFHELRKAWPNQRIVQFSQLPVSLPQSVVSRYMPARQSQREGSDKTGANILAEHPFSRAEVSFPARLQRIHPQAALVALPFPVGEFALGRLESPLLTKLLGRNPYLKVTSGYEDAHPNAAPFTQLAEGFLSDLSLAEQRQLALGLTQAVAASLTTGSGKLIFSSGQASRAEARTPELGAGVLTAETVAALAATLIAAGPAAAADLEASASGDGNPPATAVAAAGKNPLSEALPDLVPRGSTWQALALLLLRVLGPVLAPLRAGRPQRRPPQV